MASNFRPYYPRVQNRPQQGDDFQRGMQIGGVFGKDIQNLGTTLAQGIAQQKQNQVANQLLAQNYPDQPGGTDPDPDPIDAQGNPITDPDQPIPDVQLPAVKGNFQGGQAELAMRMQAAKEALSTQNLQAEIAQRKMEGNLATLRSGLVTSRGNQPQTGNAGAWSGYNMGGEEANQPASTRGGRGGKSGQSQAPVQIGSEPVTDQSQLVKHFDGTYGNGSFGKVISNLDQVDTTSNPGFVSFGPSGKQIKVPTSDAQVYVKQQNALRIKQGLNPFPVPGEDASLGSSVTNPYPTKNNLDVYSRPPGSWVTLPNGKVAQVPNR
jgi:hypothetical protein